MRTLRQRPRAARQFQTGTNFIIGASLAAACLTGPAFGQDITSGGTIVLPTVDVETTEAPAPAVKPAPRATPRRVTTAAPRAPQTCTPALRGTPVCAAQDAADAAARAEAEDAAAAAAAEARKNAGSNPNADPDAPFRATRLNNTKLQGEILDTPKTVTTITQEVIDTTNATSVRQLARTTPGVSLGFGEGGNAFGDNIYIRGFKANNDVYVDGVRDPGISVRETFATEQVEILKGPSGSVAGRGTTGGALNIASKRAQDTDFFNMSTEVSSAGTKRLTFDLNEGAGGRVQLRLNGMLQEGETAGRDGAYDNREGLAAALKYQLTDQITLEADYLHTHISQMPDWGVPYVTDSDTTDAVAIPNGPVTEFGVARDTFYGVQGRDFQEVTQNVATARLTWDFDNGASLTNTLRASKSVNDYILTAPSRTNDNGSANPADWTVGLSFKSLYQETEVISNDTELKTTADFLGAQHQLVAGLHVSKEKVRATNYTDLASEDYPVGASGCTIPVVNPDSSVCWNGAAPVRSDVFTTTRVNTVSAYLVDRIALGQQWILDAGVRVDHYEISRDGTDRNGAAYRYARSDTMLNGNLGLTWKPRKNLSFYGAFGTSSNPMGQEIAAGGGYYGGLDTAGQALAPEINYSAELGVKYELNKHLLLTAALFQTVKDNAREDIGPRGASVTYDTLKYRMRGIELGVAGKLADRVGLYGGAVFMQSEILESQDAAAIGQSVPTITHQQINLLATYDVTDKLMLGAQFNWNGVRDLGANVPNGNTLPAYFTVDMVGSYDLGSSADIRFGVKNLGDVTYYDTAYRSGEPFTYVAPGREIWAAVDFRF